jgi:hypothetical protein
VAGFDASDVEPSGSVIRKLSLTGILVTQIALSIQRRYRSKSDHEWCLRDVSERSRREREKKSLGTNIGGK